MKRTFPDWAVYLLGCAVIILLGIYMTSGISQFMDIQLSDETKYMTGGMNFFDRVPKGWGPSYSAWYRLLYFVEKDPVALHYLNFKVLAIGVSMLLFVALSRLKVPVIIAFFVGACFLFADLNIESWPRISHFAACALLTAVIISTFLRSTYLKLLLFAMTALGISYARPEIGLSFMIMLAVTAGYVLYRKFRLDKVEWGVTLALFPIVALFFMKLGVPMLSSKGKPDIASGNYPRSVTAYGQHFYLNYSEWSNSGEQILFRWDEVFNEFYDVDPSLIRTLMSNIPITVKHVSVNLWNYIRKSFDYTSGVFLPDKILYLPAWLKLIIVLGMIGSIVWLIGWPAYRDGIREHLRKYAAEYLLIFVLTIPPMISCTLIYPREHYLMLHIPLLFMIAAPLLFIHLGKGVENSKAAVGMVILAALLFAVLPRGKKFDHFAVWQDRTGPVNLSAVRAINDMGVDEPYTIIVNEGNIDPYLDNPDVFSLVGYAQLKGIPFDQAIDTFNIKMVYVTSLLEDDPFFQQDTTWMNFLEDPSSLDFRRVDLATPYSYLLVDQSLDID